MVVAGVCLDGSNNRHAWCPGTNIHVYLFMKAHPDALDCQNDEFKNSGKNQTVEFLVSNTNEHRPAFFDFGRIRKNPYVIFHFR